MSRKSSAFRYQPFYCEENAWHLCQHPALAGRAVDVVFVSNPGRRVAMWHQRAAPPGSPIFWDYHVFVMTRDPFEIWDLDTDLGMPIAAEAYLASCFRSDAREDYAPWFRVVEAGEFVRHFASDRSHMRDAEGRFVAAPPPWPAIGEACAVSNLMRFVEMETPFLGDVRRALLPRR